MMKYFYHQYFEKKEQFKKIKNLFVMKIFVVNNIISSLIIKKLKILKITFDTEKDPFS